MGVAVHRFSFQKRHDVMELINKPVREWIKWSHLSSNRRNKNLNLNWEVHVRTRALLRKGMYLSFYRYFCYFATYFLHRALINCIIMPVKFFLTKHRDWVNSSERFQFYFIYYNYFPKYVLCLKKFNVNNSRVN